MKPTLITGATGFLGQYVVEQLRGRPLRLLARGATPWDGQDGIETVRGDVTSPIDVEKAVAGCGAIYHLAGLVSRNPRDAEMMRRVHVDSTRLVCEAALRHGVSRVVLASSSGTIAVSKEPKEFTETAPYPMEAIRGWEYYVSKVEAEKVGLQYAGQGLDLVIVNPALLLGPGDVRGSSTGDVKAFLEGQILTAPSGGMSFVDARDAAQGVVAAMERGTTGERYLLGGANWTFRKLMQEAGKIAGMRAPVFGAPTWLALATAPILWTVMPLIGRKFTLDRETIEMAGHFWYCDSTKAKRELGYATRDPLVTLRETIEDLRARKVV